MRHSQGKYLKTHDYIAPARAIIRTPFYAPIQWPWRAHPGNRAVAREPCPLPCMHRDARSCCARACSGSAGAAAPVHVPGPSELLRLCMSRGRRSCCACACSGSAGTAAPVHVRGGRGWPFLYAEGLSYHLMAVINMPCSRTMDRCGCDFWCVSCHKIRFCLEHLSAW